MKIDRVWAMPNKRTFQIPPIKDLIYEEFEKEKETFVKHFNKEHQDIMRNRTKSSINRTFERQEDPTVGTILTTQTFTTSIDISNPLTTSEVHTVEDSLREVMERLERIEIRLEARLDND